MPIKTHGDLYYSFEAWLSGILRKPMPAEVVAFVFNLYEGEESYEVQLAGCATFDVENEEWATTDVFSTGENLFEISRALVGSEWTAGLFAARSLITRYLDEGAQASKLKEARAVAVGFVDGDLDVIRSIA